MKRRMFIGSLLGVTLFSLLVAFQRHEEAEYQREMAEYWRLEAQRLEADATKLRQTAHIQMIRNQDDALEPQTTVGHKK